MKGIEKHNRLWSEEEEDFLIESWGYKTADRIASELHRKPTAIIKRAKVLQLGSPIDAEYITRTSLSKILDIDGKTLINMGIPFRRKKFKNRYFHVIRMVEVIRWLKNNQDKFNAAKIEEYGLGVEPEWLKEKRKADRNLKVRDRKKFDEKDDANLRAMYRMNIPIEQIAIELKRSPSAIRRRLYRIGLKKVKKKCVLWSREEEYILKELLYNTDKDLKAISELTGRTVSAVKKKIYREYNSSYSEIRGINKKPLKLEIKGQQGLKIEGYIK